MVYINGPVLRVSSPAFVQSEERTELWVIIAIWNVDPYHSGQNGGNFNGIQNMEVLSELNLLAEQAY